MSDNTVYGRMLEKREEHEVSALEEYHRLMDSKTLKPSKKVTRDAIAELEGHVATYREGYERWRPRAEQAEADARGWADSFKQAEAALDSFLGPDGGRTVIELRAALAARGEEMATIQWLAREAIAATWPVRPSDETIESEYQELLADARRGTKP